MLALLLILTATAVAALIMPMLLVQIRGARQDVGRADQLAAAQSGLQVALARFRAATDAAGNGQLSSLPCGSITGPVGSGTARFQVSIEYFSADPHGSTPSWRAQNALACITGSGTAVTPGYALLTAVGTADPGSSWTGIAQRTLQTTYVFQLSNRNIPGGLIRVYRTSTSKDLCLDAGSGEPVAGTNVTMQQCAPGSVRQSFAYNPNLTLSLVSSKTSANPLGLCLDAGTAPTTGAVLAMQPCAAVTAPRQQWSMNDTANFEGTGDGRTLDGMCFTVKSPDTEGSVVVVSPSCGGPYDDVRTFLPEAAAGAGASGASSGQLVNFNQFGRCLDVTEQNVNYGYLIDWPCKQVPDPSLITWNQRWALPQIDAKTGTGTGRIITSPAAGTPYCLTSPGSTATGRYVTVAPCPATSTPATTWTVSSRTGSYDTSYRITDFSGNCLQPTDPGAATPDLYNAASKVSKIVLAACSGSTMQKWNAPPNIDQPSIKDTHEL